MHAFTTIALFGREMLIVSYCNITTKSYLLNQLQFDTHMDLATKTKTIAHFVPLWLRSGTCR